MEHFKDLLDQCDKSGGAGFCKLNPPIWGGATNKKGCWHPEIFSPKKTQVI